MCVWRRKRRWRRQRRKWANRKPDWNDLVMGGLDAFDIACCYIFRKRKKIKAKLLQRCTHLLWWENHCPCVAHCFYRLHVIQDIYWDWHIEIIHPNWLIRQEVIIISCARVCCVWLILHLNSRSRIRRAFANHRLVAENIKKYSLICINWKWKLSLFFYFGFVRLKKKAGKKWTAIKKIAQV